MQDNRSKAADGSILFADIYAERMVALTRNKAVKKTLDYTNEGMEFSLDLSSDYANKLSEYVQSESMTIGETFFMGYKDKKGPYAVVVELRCD